MRKLFVCGGEIVHPLINCTAFIDIDNILDAEFREKRADGTSCGACAVYDKFNIFRLFTDYPKRVYQGGRCYNCRSVLIVMKNRYIAYFL